MTAHAALFASAVLLVGCALISRSLWRAALCGLCGVAALVASILTYPLPA